MDPFHRLLFRFSYQLTIAYESTGGIIHQTVMIDYLICIISFHLKTSRVDQL